jgi:chromosome segregation ATPase
MGLFTSKIALGVLAGGFTLGGAGLLFTGSDTLQNASNFVKDAGNKIVQYQSNQDALLGKINTLKSDATSKINTANATITVKQSKINDLQGQITQLQTDKSALESQVSTLQGQIKDLQDQLTKANGDLDATKKSLADLTNQYNQKVAELNKANQTICNLQKELQDFKDKAVQADKFVAQLEGEVQKANTEVAAHGQVVDQVKEQTKDDKPMTSDQIDAIDTTTPDVNSQN